MWEQAVRAWQPSFRIWQIGVEGHPKIAGCDFHFLAPKKRSSARELFALMSRAEHFIGVDSGPMHIARAFDVRSMILVESGLSPKVFENRRKYPYFLHQNRVKSFLYEGLSHLNVASYTSESLIRELNGFLFQEKVALK
jgi:ADP-heptose:LPS heptosyltransferase